MNFGHYQCPFVVTLLPDVTVWFTVIFHAGFGHTNDDDDDDDDDATGEYIGPINFQGPPKP